MTQIHPIPCNIITGFLGVGKTTTILNLLKNKPNHETWAVLVNEFGEIGLDGALIEAEQNQETSVFIREVPGGCMCCASGLPMQVALNMLIMKAKPDRLLIEPTGLGHPKEVLSVLSGEHYQDVLSIHSTLTLIDARHFSSPKHLTNDTYQQQLDVADLFVVNKSDLASEHDVLRFERYISDSTSLSTTPFTYIENGLLNIKYLDVAANVDHRQNHLHSSMGQHNHKHHAHQHIDHTAHTNEEEPTLPECGYLVKMHQEEAFVSVGWRIHQDKVYRVDALIEWLKNLRSIRIKAFIHCEEGYVSLNLNPSDTLLSDKPFTAPPVVFAKKLRPESRIEMIFQDESISSEMVNQWTQFLCG